jgi:S1-C subfamily serine protease
MNFPSRFFARAALFALAVSLFCVQVPAAPPQAVLDAQARRIAVMAKAKDAVLAIFPAGGQGGGSGVVISPDGYALTNFHVVQPCGKYMQCGIADGKAYDAVLVGLDPTGDVALIKLFGRDDFPAAEIGDSDRVRPGDWAFAAGNPFLLATNFQPTITYGIISAVHRYQPPSGTLLEYADCLQTDASINPGNSGGPLFDAEGRLIGINGRGSFEKRGRVNVGAAYAISINQIKHFIPALRGGLIVDHATLGALAETDEHGNAKVSEILDDSDAWRRGLRMDDEIISFGGRPISSANSLKNALGIYPKEWRVPLSYRRKGQRYDVLVRLQGVHGEEELLEKIGAARQKPPILDPAPNPDKKKPDEKKPSPDQPPPQHPKPRAGHPARPELPIPEIVLKHFKEKHGFANYYFNEREQDRIWKAWEARFKPSELKGAWVMTGPLAAGNGEFRFLIDDAGAELKLPSNIMEWKAGDSLAENLQPPHSGGLMQAMFLWRRLALQGLARFGEVHYAGAAPLPGREGLADVLVGTHKGVHCRFYFDPAEGHLVALEMFSADDADPCELYFSDYRESAGRFLPGKIEVRHGDERFATLKPAELKAEKAGGKVN